MSKLTTRRWALAGLALLIALSAVSTAVFTRHDHHARAEAVLRWGYYITWDDSSLTSLQAHINQLDIVSPYYYHLTPNGSLKSFIQPDVVQFMRASGVKILPLIQNEAQWDEFHNNIDTAEKRQAIVDKLVDMVDVNGFDGVHIDFEGVNASDQALLTSFMTTLSGVFHQHGWLVSQAVIARSSDAPSTWGGAYDYRALAKLNDYVVVMAYDYTSAGSTTPGAVAPLWWVSNVVGYSEDRIPPEKLLLGIPLYGYDWNTKKGGGATAIDYPTAAQLAARPGAKSGFSNDDGAPWIEYTDDQGDTHKVWYEDADSFEKKIEVLIDHDLAGFAVWRVGHEDPADWTIIQGLQTPATRLPPVEDSASRIYFRETGHTLAYGFLDYWRANGGLARFGYPLTEEFDEHSETDGNTYTVQYFERARFEYHPEYAGTQYAVLLGHVGRWALTQEGVDPWDTAVGGAYDGRDYFAESGHTLGGVFRDYWEANGGLATFGYPLSEEVIEVNPDDGHTYTVQYFERARFEYHPEYAGTPSEVLIGLLGKAMLRERGWVR
jgi:spore germination protein YaaH